MNILITGANGQLGREMRRVSVDSTDYYLFTDIAELDITDIKSVRNLVNNYRIQVIVNCAAYTNVDKAEDDEQVADLLNNHAVRNLAEAAKSVDAILIHISTDYIFKGDANIPYCEDQPANPLGVYGYTKYAGEQSLIATGCRYIIFRTAWLYSPFGKNFVKTMRQLTADKDSLTVVFDQVGSPTYAGDLAFLIHKVIEKRMFEHQGIYHFSNEGVCSWYDFAMEICEQSGNICDIKPCHSDEFQCKVKRPHYSVLDKTKVKSTFGITIPHWKQSLRKCIDELNKYENGI